ATRSSTPTCASPSAADRAWSKSVTLAPRLQSSANDNATLTDAPSPATHSPPTSRSLAAPRRVPDVALFAGEDLAHEDRSSAESRFRNTPRGAGRRLQRGVRVTRRRNVDGQHAASQRGRWRPADDHQPVARKRALARRDR